MKTSEFRKYLEENWKFEETEDCFKIHGLVVVNKKSNRLEFLTLMYLDSLNTITLVKKIIEYACTPISEREEEKYFYLKLRFSGDLDKRCIYLNYHKNFNSFTLNSNMNVENIKTIFTDKDIIELNIDIKLFEKEEVWVKQEKH